MAENENAPATKKDLAALETRLDLRMGSLSDEMHALEERLSEQMRDMQTELLKAFLPWQQDVKIQFCELEVNTGNSVTAVKERMNILERRLWEIEKRLLIDPPAA